MNQRTGSVLENSVQTMTCDICGGEYQVVTIMGKTLVPRRCACRMSDYERKLEERRKALQEGSAEDAWRYLRESGITKDRLSNRWALENLGWETVYRDDAGFIRLHLLSDPPTPFVYAYSPVNAVGQNGEPAGYGSQCGKTTMLLSALIHWLVKHPQRIKFVSCHEWIERFSYDNGEWLRELADADVLFIDDFLRKTTVTDRQHGRLFELFEKRFENRKMTWITSNHPPSDVRVLRGTNAATPEDDYALVGRLSKPFLYSLLGVMWEWKSRRNIEAYGMEVNQ